MYTIHSFWRYFYANYRLFVNTFKAICCYKLTETIRFCDGLQIFFIYCQNLMFFKNILIYCLSVSLINDINCLLCFYINMKRESFKLCIWLFSILQCAISFLKRYCYKYRITFSDAQRKLFCKQLRQNKINRFNLTQFTLFETLMSVYLFGKNFLFVLTLWDVIWFLKNNTIGFIDIRFDYFLANC